MNIYVVVFIQVLIAGGTHIVAKAVVRDIDAVTLTFIRSLISSFGLSLLFVARRQRLRIKKEDWPKMAVLGFLGLVVNQYFYLYGLKFSSAANGALLYATTPVLVLVLSRIMLGERVTPRKAGGVAMAFIGIGIVVFERGVDFSSSYAFGNLMILLAVLAWALFTVLGKKMIVTYGAFQTTTVAMITGMVLFLPAGIFSAFSFPFSSLTPLHWGGILYLGVGTSIIGYLLWYYVLGRIDVAKAAVFANGQPIIATLLSLIFLDYTITPAFVVGGLVTIAGVILTQTG